MFKILLNLLDLDGYRSLFCKFSDKSTISYEAHCWVADIWRQTFYQMLKQIKIRLAFSLRRAWYVNDWDTMYEILLEWYQVEHVV